MLGSRILALMRLVTAEESFERISLIQLGNWGALITGERATLQAQGTEGVLGILLGRGELVSIHDIQSRGETRGGKPAKSGSFS